MKCNLEEFFSRIKSSQILGSDAVSYWRERTDPGHSVSKLAQEMVKTGTLTDYQVEELVEGRLSRLVLGNYVLQRCIGQGGMGQVYEAIHKKMERRVALKVMHAKQTGDPQIVRRFQREVRAAARLQHPNIVTAFDAGESDGIHFLVMELVQGRDLGAIIQAEGPLSLSKTIDCLLQTCRGLDYAHRMGIYHRDIKPNNLLMDSNGVIKILDMGLARFQSLSIGGGLPNDQSDSHSIVGSVDFMAPEQAINSNQADHRSDIYSLGCTLYFLLTGRAPYSGGTVMECLIAHREARIPSLKLVHNEVSDSLEELFQKMLAKNPADRPQSTMDIINKLQPRGNTLRSPAIRGAAEAFVAVLSSGTPTQVRTSEQSNPTINSYQETIIVPETLPLDHRTEKAARSRESINLWIIGISLGVVVLGLIAFGISFWLF